MESDDETVVGNPELLEPLKPNPSIAWLDSIMLLMERYVMARQSVRIEQMNDEAEKLVRDLVPNSSYCDAEFIGIVQQWRMRVPEALLPMEILARCQSKL